MGGSGWWLLAAGCGLASMLGSGRQGWPSRRSVPAQSPIRAACAPACRAGRGGTLAPPMPTFRVDVLPSDRAADQGDHHLEREARMLGLDGLGALRRSRYYLIEGDLDAERAGRLARSLLTDPV